MGVLDSDAGVGVLIPEAEKGESVLIAGINTAQSTEDEFISVARTDKELNIGVIHAAKPENKRYYVVVYTTVNTAPDKDPILACCEFWDKEKAIEYIESMRDRWIQGIQSSQFNKIPNKNISYSQKDLRENPSLLGTEELPLIRKLEEVGNKVSIPKLLENPNLFRLPHQ